MIVDERQRLKFILGIFAAGLIAFTLFLFVFWPRTTTHRVTFDDVSFKVQIADEPDELSKGLSGTPPLGAREGLLFVFEDSGMHSFWMKDMNYPIDILWLNERKSIVHIEQNIQPESYPASFVSNVPAKYVLEIPADATEKYGIKQGDTASFRLP